MDDMREKGRMKPGHSCGTRRSSAKLTEEKVTAIRARRAQGEKLKALSEEYGVSETKICQVAKRQAWAHVA
jgi:hypothetical protein